MATYFYHDSIIHVRVKACLRTVCVEALLDGWTGENDLVFIVSETVLSLSSGVDVKNLLILYVHIL
jgi:hypothetical protein